MCSAVEQGEDYAAKQQTHADKSSWNRGIHWGLRRDGQNRITGNGAQQGKNEGYPPPDKAAALKVFEGGVRFHGSLPAAIILVQRYKPKKIDVPDQRSAVSGHTVGKIAHRSAFNAG
jgi:hypothetical protein